MILLDLGLNAVAMGLLIGGLYAALSLGLAVTFGLVHIPNVAHPAFIVAGAYFVWIANGAGLDPILAATLGAPFFYLLGGVLYEIYERVFERRGRSGTLQSFTFFFGVALVTEVALAMAFGVDLRAVEASYVGSSLTMGLVSLPYRFLTPALLAPVMILLLWLHLTRTRTGLAVRAAAQDEAALRISAIDPRRIRRHAFGLAMATAVLAGAALILTGPVEPFAGRHHIGRVFAVVVLAGMGSVPGTLAAACIIGVAESLVATFVSPSWAPGVAFAILLATLALRPTGLFGTAR